MRNLGRTDAYLRLHDAAERLALRFYAICGYGRPEFVEHRDRLEAQAKTFWDTYWVEMVDYPSPKQVSS
jgi:hypothetical protein